MNTALPPQTPVIFTLGKGTRKSEVTTRDAKDVWECTRLVPEKLQGESAPLDGVQAILHGQRDVAAPDGGGDGACEDVGLTVEADSHAVGVHHPQGSIIAELVAVSHLIWKNAVFW